MVRKSDSIMSLLPLVENQNPENEIGSLSTSYTMVTYTPVQSTDSMTLPKNVY